MEEQASSCQYSGDKLKLDAFVQVCLLLGIKSISEEEEADDLGKAGVMAGKFEALFDHFSLERHH